MRILHLASEYPPQLVFGLGRFVRDLAEEQVKQGHEVTVVTNSMSGKLHESISSGVRILRVNQPPPKPPTNTGCILVFNVLLMQRALDLGQKCLSKFDVVCSHDWMTAPAAQALANVFGPSHISTFHDIIVGKRLGELKSDADRFTTDTERWTAYTSRHVIANSEATKKELIAAYGAEPEQISVIPCAISPDSFRVTSDPKRLTAFREGMFPDIDYLVLYVGRLDLEKGVNVLLDAFAKARLTCALLCIVGGGSLDKALREHARNLGMGERIRFLGYVENPALAYLYKSADVLVCPSLYEPFGMVAMEGMFQGTAPIVSDTGGLSDLVSEGVTGLKVKPGNVPALSTAMEQLARNDGLRRTLGTQAREMVLKDRTWPVACRKTIKVYRKHSSVQSAITSTGDKHLFIAGDLLPGSGYSAGRIGRSLFEKTKAKNGNIKKITTESEDMLQILVTNKYDLMLLQAFNMAAKVLSHSKHPPSRITAYHWNGLLASSVLESLSIKTIYYSPSIFKVQEENNTEIFDYCIRIWAASMVKEIVVPNERTKELLMSKSIASDVNDFERPHLVIPPVADKKALRGCIAAPHEKIVAVALRQECLFDGKALLSSAIKGRDLGLALRWIVCGSGPHHHNLKASADQLPVNFFDHVPEQTLNAILSISDIAAVPLVKASASRFVDEALAFSLPVVTPVGTKSFLKSSPLVHEVDFSQPSQVIAAISAILKLTQLSLQQQEHESALPEDRATVTSDDIVLYNNWGIGDEVLLSAVARELKRVYPEKRVWIRSRYKFRYPKYSDAEKAPAWAAQIETIYQNPSLYGPGWHTPYPGHLVQQMLDKVALDTGLKVEAMNVRPELELVAQSVKEHHMVLLNSQPNPSLPSKDWGIKRWSKLCKLLDSHGLRILQVGAPTEPKLPHTEDKRGYPLAKLPGLCQAAGLIVCVVGLMMHIAAATRTPAIVIYGGREDPLIDGYPEHIHLGGDPLQCRGRWGCHLPPDKECEHNMRCMEGITPEIVFFFVEKIMASSGAAS